MKKTLSNQNFEKLKEKIMASELYIAKKEDVDRLSAVAADSFLSYPLHLWFTEKEKNLYKNNFDILKITLKAMLDNCLIYADSEQINGFIAVLPMDFKGTKPISFIATGGAKLFFREGFGILRRMLTYENYAMSLKAKYNDCADFYIYSLSVKQSEQGKGIASRLLLPLAELCNAENIGCYLETNNEKNVALYEHFGFELVERGVVPKSDVQHFGMLRKKRG